MISPPGAPRPKSVLWNFKFVGTALAGSLTLALVSTFAPPPAQIAVLGSSVSILAGLFVAYVEQEDAREKSREVLLGTLRVPLELAREQDLFQHFVSFGDSLIALARGRDEPVLKTKEVRPGQARLQQRTAAHARRRTDRLLRDRDMADRLRATPPQPGPRHLPVRGLGQGA
jgi:hypothetical protein